MTTCGGWLESLSVSLDGALPENERGPLETHLKDCRGCQQRLRSLRALKHAIARLASRETPPGAVRAHVEALVLRDRGAGRSALALRVALAASLAVGTWAFVTWRHDRRSPSAELADALAGDHLHSVPEAMPAEVATEDPGEVVKFFTGRVPFDPVAPAIPGARLLGGRLCQVDGRRVQLLFYRTDSKATVSLFVADRALGNDGCREARGLQVCSRGAGSLTLVLVGSGEAEQLRLLVEGAAF
jgi:anti-sigma factor RsiW